jgi:SpoVK/Ycf46/Vps4 family AAA+-type ATPase
MNEMTFPKLPSRLRDVELLPSQAIAYDKLKQAIEACPIVSLTNTPGRGKTTTLRKLARELDAHFLGYEEVCELLRKTPLMHSFEAIHDLVMRSLRTNPIVVCDDFPFWSLINDEAAGWARSSTWLVTMSSIASAAVREDMRLVAGGGIPSDIGEPVAKISIPPLGAEDYAAFLNDALGSDVAGVDFERLHRTAPELDLYQLGILANFMRGHGPLATSEMERCLEQDILSTNLKMKEVESLSFDNLPGTEAIAEALETHIVLPFKNREIAEELGAKPRRGVLLYGPPGTGKTSIGRALAHRMQGRFFLIDGTCVTEPPLAFFHMIEGIVREAKANSPSVLFIDDADVLFQIDHIAGLSRYLLTLLDGLESETSSNVCVILTAMDAQKLPEALLRSGRVELWLETQLPDEAARALILRRWMEPGAKGFETIDVGRIAKETGGFTPADLRRLIGDAKLLHAADLVAGNQLRSGDDYLLAAIAELVDLRDRMARQLADDNLRVRAYA